ncbi:MAG TPA: RES family NAD+ phosphorylase [Chloroflexota bacterium]|nr:RES family NAD+ phosphorylase [Chloroflexota bacterium]
MGVPNDWDASRAVASCQIITWAGSAWRAHRRKYQATDPGGARRISGRYHRGLDQFPEDRIWPALYLSLGPETCLGEVLRHISITLLPQLNDFRLSEISLRLQVIVDCRDPSILGLTVDDLSDDYDYRVTQDLAAAAIATGAEGILVPSATRLGDNLILFPTRLHPDSQVTVVGSREPKLYVPRLL